MSSENTNPQTTALEVTESTIAKLARLEARLAKEKAEVQRCLVQLETIAREIKDLLPRAKADLHAAGVFSTDVLGERFDNHAIKMLTLSG